MVHKNRILPLDIRRIWVWVFTVLLISCGCESNSQNQVRIRGIYGHPQPLWDKQLHLQDLGVNAVFVHGASIDQQMVERARSEGAKVFAEYPTLNGKNYVEEHPEAWAIDETGSQVGAASWFMGVCPNDEGFRQFRLSQLQELLTNFELDGIWMDYVHWHAQFEEPEPILPETCFCNKCISKFSKEMNLDVPAGNVAEKANWILTQVDESWREWRCRVILEWVTMVRQEIRKIRPEALLGVYHCPWTDEEFDGARRRILGLDYDMLKDSVDVFSPMVYHGRMGRKPDWVQENIEWFCDRLDIRDDVSPEVWPIVQAYNNGGEVSPEEFKAVMQGGLSGKSTGVMMFTTRAIADNEDKIEVMKTIYTQRQP